jgi:hypothetical protein
LRKKEAQVASKVVRPPADDVFGDVRGEAASTRKIVDGFTVYTEEELGLNKDRGGGDTPDCPFDCPPECCS